MPLNGAPLSFPGGAGGLGASASGPRRRDALGVGASAIPGIGGAADALGAGGGSSGAGVGGAAGGLGWQGAGSTSLGTATGQIEGAYNDMLRYYNSYMAGQAPTLAGYQAEAALAGARLGLEGQDYAAQRGYAQRDYDLGMRGIGLDYQNLGYQREANNLKYSDLALDRQNVGIDRRGVDVTRDYLNKMRGYAGDTLGQQLYDAMRQGVYQTVQNNSQATANGAWFAPMRQFENANIYGDTLNAGNQARTGYAKTIAGYDRDSANADLDMARLDVREKGISNDEQRVAIANKQLDIQAAKLGLTGEQMRLALDKGLQNLGMSNAMTVNQIMSGLASNNAQVQQLAMNMMMQASQAAGYQGYGSRGLGSIASQLPPYAT